MASLLDLYEPLDIIGNGSFGIIRKVRRKTDGVVSVFYVPSSDLLSLSLTTLNERLSRARNLTSNACQNATANRSWQKCECLTVAILTTCTNTVSAPAIFSRTSITNISYAITTDT